MTGEKMRIFEWGRWGVTLTNFTSVECVIINYFTSVEPVIINLKWMVIAIITHVYSMECVIITNVTYFYFLITHPLTWGLEFRAHLFCKESDAQGAVTHPVWLPALQAPPVDQDLNNSRHQVLQELWWELGRGREGGNEGRRVVDNGKRAQK